MLYLQKRKTALISFKHVTKKYNRGHIALNNISLEIQKGEMVFLQGHSGAGKSTLLKLIALFETPTRGHIEVANTSLEDLKTSKIPFYRRRLGFITQNPKLLQSATVFENVAVPLFISGFARNDIKRRVQAALERVGLSGKEKMFPRLLSEGEKQRVGIARAVVHKPVILLADEPTGNLDPELSKEIMTLFERFHQVGVTVLIASHDKNLLATLPYRKLHLAQGQLLSTEKGEA